MREERKVLGTKIVSGAIESLWEFSRAMQVLISAADREGWKMEDLDVFCEIKVSSRTQRAALIVPITRGS